MQIFKLLEDKYLVHLKNKHSWGEFQKKAKVKPDSYSSIFAHRLYSAVFVDSTDLKEEYRNYYELEYGDINRYLFWRYGISEEIINELYVPYRNLFIVTFPLWMDEDAALYQSVSNLFQELEGEL